MSADAGDPWADVSAVILAGGLGTRLRAAVADRPKGLAVVAGRSFLSYVLDQVADAGVREVVLCTGHLADQIEAAFGRQYRGMEIRYSRERSPLGTGGALRLALPRATGRTLLVMNGDSFCRADLGAFLSAYRQYRNEPTLLLVEVADARRFGRVVCDDAGRVVRFAEKGEESGGGWVNAGIYLLQKSMAEDIPSGQPVSLEREVFPAWIGQGLRGHRTESPFLDIGTPESYAAAEAFFAK